MIILTYRTGDVAGIALGLFILSVPVAQAWTDAEIAECLARNRNGMVFTPNGRGSKGSLGCVSYSRDPNWTPEKERARHEAARKAEEEWEASPIQVQAPVPRRFGLPGADTAV